MNQIENHCFPPDATDAMLHSRTGQTALQSYNGTGPISMDVVKDVLLGAKPDAEVPMKKRVVASRGQ